MSLDRFVIFNHKVPHKEQIELILQDYLNEAGHVTLDEGVFYAMLIGKPTLPFKRIFTPSPPYPHEDRWFEVYLGLDKTWKGYPYINVMTRQADEYTNVVAEGFAALIARFYDGKREL